MDRDKAIEHLKALVLQEQASVRKPRPYLDRAAARSAEQRHWNNVEALRTAITELESVKYLIPVSPCPEPLCEGDEYRCSKCLIRWDINEEKPNCQGTTTSLL